MRHGHALRHVQRHVMKWVERWYVQSHSSDKVYTVSLANDNETWGCSCPHWTKNYPRPKCKHIKEVQEMLEKDHAYADVMHPNVEYDEFFTEEEFKL